MKPRIKAESMQYLVKIDEYIREYDLRGEALLNAASDELDGAVYREEIDDLVRRKLLSVIKFTDEIIWDGHICGYRWTVVLTPRAINLFWPARA